LATTSERLATERMRGESGAKGIYSNLYVDAARDAGALTRSTAAKYIRVVLIGGAVSRADGSLRIGSSIVLLAFAAACMNGPAHPTVDRAWARSINSSHAFDDPAHPMRPVAQGAPADTDFDALPLDGIPPFELPARLKPDDPIWRQAQNALYHIPLTMSGAT